MFGLGLSHRERSRVCTRSLCARCVPSCPVGCFRYVGPSPEDTTQHNTTQHSTAPETCYTHGNTTTAQEGTTKHANSHVAAMSILHLTTQSQHNTEPNPTVLADEARCRVLRLVLRVPRILCEARHLNPKLHTHDPHKFAWRKYVGGLLTR